MTERIDVTENFDHQTWLDWNCQTCGKPFTLYYNGGELDERECCGQTYRLATPRIDLVIKTKP